MSEPVIEVRHLSKSFGTHVVLRDVDFTVNAGDECQELWSHRHRSPCQLLALGFLCVSCRYDRRS